MGIDWEYLLGTGGENLERAYNDAIPEPDSYPCDDSLYEDDEFNGEVNDGEECEAYEPEEDMDPEILLNAPLCGLSHRQMKAAFFVNDNHAPYLISVLKGERNTWKGNDTTLTGMDDQQYPVCDRLFHANSVKTALSFIRNKELFSRAYGEEHGLQTTQSSDSLDKLLGIYNDIFFDNIDIPYRSGTNRSAYGPVMFVFNIDILKGQKIRILKSNPWSCGNREGLAYNDLFYSGIEEIKSILSENNQYNQNRVAFLGDFNHHTTVFDTPVLPFGDNLEAIYLEQCFDGSGRENELKDSLECELRNVGLDIPVIIRKDPPNLSFTGLAADAQELWNIQPEYTGPEVE